GFIETEDHQKEVFFHYRYFHILYFFNACEHLLISNFFFLRSIYDGNIQTLNLGQEVEYYTSKNSPKLSAEYVRKLPSGTIPTEEVQQEVLNGVISRSVRCLNPDQEEYPGIIRVRDPCGENPSINNKKYE